MEPTLTLEQWLMNPKIGLTKFCPEDRKGCYEGMADAYSKRPDIIAEIIRLVAAKGFDVAYNHLELGMLLRGIPDNSRIVIYNAMVYIDEVILKTKPA